MQPGKPAISQLLLALYDAAADSSLWPAFLHELGSVTQSNQVVLLLHDLKRGAHAVSLHSGMDERSIRQYQEYYGTRDLWLQKARPLVHTGWVGVSQEICSREELLGSEFYNDYLLANEMGHAMWSVVENSELRVINVGLYRGPRAQPYRNKELKLLRLLAPHLERALRLHLQFSELKAQADNLERAMDNLPTGIILLGKNGQVLHTNRAAANILRENDGLVMARGRLRAERNAESAVLENLIARAGSAGKEAGTAEALTVSRRVRRGLQVLIAAARTAGGDRNGPLQAIVFLTDPTQRLGSNGDILRALYGLTPAESRVALLLGDGHAPPAITGLLGVSLNTLKTQLASIYRKTGTARQSQLVRLMAQLASTAPKN